MRFKHGSLPAKTGNQIQSRFVTGVKQGGVGAIFAAGATVIAGAFLAPKLVTGGLLVGGGYGRVQTGISVSNNLQSGNAAGLVYDAGSVIGGLLGGAATGFGVRYSITRETNLPTSLGDFFGWGKGIELNRPGQNVFQALHAAFSKGPDLGGASLAVGLAAGATRSGCGN